MANLSGQNIGLNYKSILNLGSTINTPLSTTLQAITDGDGVASPLQLATNRVALGSGATGTSLLNFPDAGTTAADGISFGTGSSNLYRSGANTLRTDGQLQIAALTFTSNSSFITSSGVVSLSPTTLTGSSATSALSIAQTWNTTGSPTAIDLNVTNTASGASARLMDLRVGGSSVFSVSPTGRILTNQFITGNAGNNLRLGFTIDNISVNTITGETFGIRYAATGTNATSAYTNGHRFTHTGHVNTSGTPNVFRFEAADFNAPSGNGNYRPFWLTYSINNSGPVTGATTGIFLDATETNLNGMTHDLMHLQVGGVSRARFGRGGELQISDYITFGTNGARIGGSSTDILTLRDNGGTTFNRLCFGGTTSAFPSIKRSSARLQLRLADDSDFTGLDLANATSTQPFNVNLDNQIILRSHFIGINNEGTTGIAMFSHNNLGAIQSSNSVFNSHRALLLNPFGGGGVSIGKSTNNAFLDIAPSTLTGSSATSALSIAQTWNTTGAPTLIDANVTNTASSANANLMDLKVGGNSSFRVSRDGRITLAQNHAAIANATTGQAFIKFYDVSNASMVYNVAHGSIGSHYFGFDGGINPEGSSTFRAAIHRQGVTISSVAGNQASLALNSSAALQVNSTNRGFLPPRGTNAEMLAITSPATGLIFYDTTNNKLNCYDGTNWQPCW